MSEFFQQENRTERPPQLQGTRMCRVRSIYSLSLRDSSPLSEGQGSAAEQALQLPAQHTTSTAEISHPSAVPSASGASRPFAGLHPPAAASLLASRSLWRELLEAIEAAGSDATQYLQQVDDSGYSALHRLALARDNFNPR